MEGVVKSSQEEICLGRGNLVRMRRGRCNDCCVALSDYCRGERVLLAPGCLYGSLGTQSDSEQGDW